MRLWMSGVLNVLVPVQVALRRECPVAEVGAARDIAWKLRPPFSGVLDALVFELASLHVRLLTNRGATNYAA